MATKYEIIKTDIIQKIEKGEFHPGDKIYSEGDLKKIYSVSNTTVVKALNDLVSEGYLIRRQGEGTFVRKNIKHRKVFFSEKMKINPQDNSKASGEETITLIETEQNNPEISKILGDKTGKAKLVNIQQVALANDRPWKIQNRYLLASKLDSKALLRLAQGGSVSEELQLSDNLTGFPMEMDVSVELVSKDSEKLNALRKINRFFDGEEVFALFSIARVTYDHQGEPIEYAHNYIDPNYYSIEIISE